MLAEDVEDEDHNTTRFVVLSRELVEAPAGNGPVVTSFIFNVRNLPAALYKALGGFATNGVNMTKLESYMVGGWFTATQFLAEVDGHPVGPRRGAGARGAALLHHRREDPRRLPRGLVPRGPRLTPYPELDGLLDEIEAHARSTFAEEYVGLYLVGSFALCDADQHSDCDFLVVLRSRPSGVREQAVRDLWAELPRREGKWTHDLEGSYAVLSDLAHNATIGHPWFYVDHGHTELTWSDHCNREVVRWTLREHGIAVSGVEPRTFVAPTPPDAIRERMRRDVATLLPDILSWAPTEVAWTQRYIVATYCRVLYSLVTGEVASKRMALEWGRRSLDPRWESLLVQVRDDRALGWDPARPATRGIHGGSARVRAHGAIRGQRPAERFLVTFSLTLAGVASTFPRELMARTRNVYLPVASFLYFLGEVQGWKVLSWTVCTPLPFRRHSNVAPATVLVKEYFTVDLVVWVGPLVTLVSGAAEPGGGGGGVVTHAP